MELRRALVATLHSHLKQNGWWMGSSVSTDNFMALMSTLGTVASQPRATDSIKILRPSAGVKRKTFSEVFKFGPFPPHTDGAHLRSPPRYVGLRVSESPTIIPTLLVRPDLTDLMERQRQLLSRASWRVLGSRNRFLSPILEHCQTKKAHRFRFDPIRMEHLHSECGKAFEILNHLIANSKVIQSIGDVGGVVIFDNWTMLHWRDAVPKAEQSTRKIQRITVI